MEFELLLRLGRGALLGRPRRVCRIVGEGVTTSRRRLAGAILKPKVGITVKERVWV